MSGQAVFGPTGRQVGRIQGAKVYGPNGRYVGTIVGDRLVYRSTDSATISSPYTLRSGIGADVRTKGTLGNLGDEPNLQ